MAAPELEAVRLYKEVVDRLLERAAQVKPNSQIEPPLTEGTLGEPIWQVPTEKQEVVKELNPQTQFAAVEIAFREKFYRILVRELGVDGSLYMAGMNTKFPIYEYRPQLLSKTLLLFISGIYWTLSLSFPTTVSRLQLRDSLQAASLTRHRTM
jgi:hypothetical protein